jgi:hypothetical protein
MKFNSNAMKWFTYIMTSLMLTATLLLGNNAGAANISGFPFDMAVTDVWITNAKGGVFRSGTVGPAGSPVTIHCAWTVKPTQYVQVNTALHWSQNLMKVNSKTFRAFSITIPPDKYGHKSWSSGGVLGVGSTKHSINGKTEIKNEYSFIFKPPKSGSYTVRCELDASNKTGGYEKNRTNNTRQILVQASMPLFIGTIVKKPQLHGTNKRNLHCLKGLKVSLTPNLTGIAPADIATSEKNKQVTLPLVGSGTFLGNSIMCNYASGKVKTSYTLHCKDAKKEAGPNSFWCTK